MKATGIVCRMDDLGRLVIPREIRHSMKLEDNAPLEIWTAREDGQDIICLSKYTFIDEKEETSSAPAVPEPKNDTTQLIEIRDGNITHYVRLNDTAQKLFAWLDNLRLLNCDDWGIIDDIVINEFV